MSTATTLPAVMNGPAPPSRVQLGGAMAMQQTIEDLNAIRQFVANEMREDLDYGVIPGTGSKPTLLQPGAQKIFMYFNCYPEHDVQARELDGGHVEYIVKTRLISRASQEQIGSGLGSCSTMESKYRWRNAGRVCPKCGSDAIIRGKAEYGGGWICFGKKGGCGAKFRDNDPGITGQSTGRVENPDIYDQRNTVLKMGKKRSQVDAAHGLGCMSELFTQDLDDYHDVMPRHEPEPEEPPRDEGRRAVNESFPQRRPRPVPDPPSEDTPPPSRLSWAAYIADRVDEAHKHWATEMALAGVDPEKRNHPDYQLPNKHETQNHFINHALKTGALKPEEVDKADRPGTRDPQRAKAAMAGLFAKAPRRIQAAVDAYFLEKERGLRVLLGMDDLIDDSQAEPAAAVEREPGQDG